SLLTAPAPPSNPEPPPSTIRTHKGAQDMIRMTRNRTGKSEDIHDTKALLYETIDNRGNGPTPENTLKAGEGALGKDSELVRRLRRSLDPYIIDSDDITDAENAIVDAIEEGGDKAIALAC